MKKFILLLTFFITSKTNGQNNNIHLNKVFCDTTISVYDLIQFDDGSFLAVGFFGDAEVNGGIFKFDNQFNLIWKKDYGGSYTDFFKFIRKINDNRYLLVGEATSIDGDLATYSPPFSTANNIWMMVIDSNGNFIRGNTYGYGSSSDVGDVKIINDNNIFISGSTVAEHGDFAGNPGDPLTWQTFIALTDTLLNKKWLFYIAGLSSDDNSSHKTTVDMHGNLIIPISSTSTSGDYAGLGPVGGKDMYLFCVDTNQNIKWRKKYAGSAMELMTNIQGDSSNNLYFTVNTSSLDGDFFTNEVKLNPSFGGISFCTLVKADSVGNIIWKHNYGSFDTTMLELRNLDPVDMLIRDNNIWVYSTIQGRDSIGEGYGWSNQQGCVDDWIIQTNMNGILENKIRFGGLRDDIATWINFNDKTNQPIIGNFSYPNTGFSIIGECAISDHFDYKIYELEQWPNQITEPNASPKFNWTISPNPTHEVIIIDFEKEFSGTLQIFNSTGNIFRTYKLNKAFSTKIQVSTLANGIYTIQLINSDGSFQKQLIVYH